MSAFKNQTRSSQLAVVKNSLDKSLLIPFSDRPVRFKLVRPQFHSMFPFYTPWDSLSEAFITTEKREVIVEFTEFWDFILHNFGGGSDDILFGENLYQKAFHSRRIFNFMRTLISSKIKSGSRNVSQIRDSLTEKALKQISEIMGEYGTRESLKTLWHIFNINVAMLNIKSIILSGEAANKDRKTIPIKFIPKLGSEFEILSLGATLEIRDLVNKPQPFIKEVYIGSLLNGEIDTVNLLRNKDRNLPRLEAERRGYSISRFNSAIENGIKVLSDDIELEFYNNYIEELENFIDGITSLALLVAKANEDPREIMLLDFNVRDGYYYRGV